MSDASTKNAGSPETDARILSESSAEYRLNIAQLLRATFYYHLRQTERGDKYETAKAEITAIFMKTRADTGIAT